MYCKSISCIVIATFINAFCEPIAHAHISPCVMPCHCLQASVSVSVM